MTISEIFEKFGEPYFRDGERRVIARVLEKGCVLSTGGGAFMNTSTRQRIARIGVSIWLKPDFEVLLGACGSARTGRCCKPPTPRRR